MEKISKKSIVLIILLSLFVAFCSVGLYFILTPNTNKNTIAVDGPSNTDRWTDSSYAENFGGGNGSSATPYLISTPGQLAYLSKNYSSYQEKYFLQTAELDMSAHYWTPIGTESSPFYGNYDGGGFAITGLYVGTESSPETYAGLFGLIESKPKTTQTFKNIVIKDSVFFGKAAGAIIGSSVNGSLDTDLVNNPSIIITISNCSASGEIYCNATEGATSGGIAGLLFGVSIEKCENHCSVTDLANNQSGSFGGTGCSFGGIVGRLWGGNMQSCKNYGTITSFSKDGKGAGAEAGTGGIAGTAMGFISNSTNYGVVNGYAAGGISGTGGTISGCANYGDITGSQRAGGITSYNFSMLSSGSYAVGNNGFVINIYVISGSISNCYNTGMITAGDSDIDVSYAGGILGYNPSITASTTSKGTITGTGSGDEYTTTTLGDDVMFSNNYNVGNIKNISTNGIVGGILGAVSYLGGSPNDETPTVSSIFINNFNVGAIEGTNKGGIIGDIGYGDIEISKNYFADSSLSAIGTDNSWSLQSDAVYLENLAELAKTQEWYANSFDEQKPWDFASTWSIDPEQNDGYPILNSVQGIAFWTDDGVRATSFAGGNGEESTPYQISSGAELGYLSYMTQNGTYYENQYFVLTDNIDLSGYYWDPIDNFKGNFNGQNYEISHLTTPVFQDASLAEGAWMTGGGGIAEDAGLFGKFGDRGQNAEILIENIILKDSIIYGTNSAGSIVAMIETGNQTLTIKNCISYAEIHCVGRSAGGITAGWMHSANGCNCVTVENCINYGDIYADGASYVGGVVGICNISISDCTNYGDIFVKGAGANNLVVGGVGAIVEGYYSNIDIKCENLKNYGNVTVSSSSPSAYVGGVVADGYFSGGIPASSFQNQGDINVAGLAYAVGGLAGNFNSLTDAFNDGNITINGSAGYVGGVVGELANRSYSSQLSNSYNSGDIIYTENSQTETSQIADIGGVVGVLPVGVPIQNCYNSGNISAQSANEYSVVGGIVGIAPQSTDLNNTQILFCFNSGEISFNGITGGIVGAFSKMEYASSSYSQLLLMNVFNVGAISGKEGMTGGIFGYVNEGPGPDPIVVYAYYNEGVQETGSGQSFGAQSKANLSSLAKTREWYLGDDWGLAWNFYSIWGFVEGQNNGYPVFVSTIEGNWIDYRASSFGGGSGTEDDPYLISTPEQLAYLAYMTNNALDPDCEYLDIGDYIFPLSYSGKYFKQTQDIDLSAHFWSSIGTVSIEGLMTGDSPYIGFGGNYDGGGFEITGMFTSSNDIAGGLFGVVMGVNMEQGATKEITIKNVTIKDSYVQTSVFFGMGAAGAIVAMIECIGTNVVIDNCHNYSPVLTHNGSGVIGGITAEEKSSVSVSNCTNYGGVLTTNFSTGVVNVNTYSSDDKYPIIVENCHNYGNLFGETVSGVFIFSSGGCSCQVINCTNSGDIYGLSISSGSDLSGIILFQNGGRGKITNCINYGNISGSGDNVGGITSTGREEEIENCINYGDIKVYVGSSSSVAGIASSSGGSKITNCINYGSIYALAPYGVCGIGKGEILNCTNYGDVTGLNFVGGIASDRFWSNDITITNCINYGDIAGENYVGGISGVGSTNSYDNFGKSFISNCTNYGAVSGQDYVGGIATVIYLNISSSDDNIYFDFSDNKNTGSVSGNNYVGGLFGQINVSNNSTLPTINMSNCLSLGDISGADFVGGFVGNINVSASTSYPVTINFDKSGIEGNITYTGANFGIFVGFSSNSFSVSNSYAVVGIADEVLVRNSDLITLDNLLIIMNDAKKYYGEDFSQFAWINNSSCPIPKNLALVSDYFTGTVTLDALTSQGWEELVIA